jgi:hypothetical protein
MADRNGYIGRAPSDSAVTVARQTFSPTGVTTDFTFASGYTPGYFDIFINGVKMIEGSDYTSTDGSTFSVLNGGVVSGDVIEGVAYKAFNAATATVGISSAGTPISTQANTLNFVGTGNTFALRGSTIDISISGGAGAGGTWTNYDSNAGVSTTKKVKIENDLEVTGVTTSTGGFVGNVTGTATGLSGSPNITINNLTGVAATFTGVLTYEDVTNVDSVGIVTAQGGLRAVGGGLTVTGVSTFFSNIDLPDDVKLIIGTDDDLEIYHDGSNSYIKETAGTGNLRIEANDLRLKNGDGTEDYIKCNQNAAVELYHNNSKKLETTGGGINVTGVVTATGSVQVGSGQSFGSSGASAAVYYGDGSNLTNLPAAGITTEAFTSSGIVTAVRLGTAQDHKITATGFTTITSSGSGTEGESHTIRIVNSGIATVGFSTYFLFPSGSAPTLPTADGAISLISFTVHDSVGAGCTQLLAGASVNYS